MNVSGTEAQVCADIAHRQKFGMNKYGISVADNPLSLLDWLQHAYEEGLDQVVYIKRAMNQLESMIEELEQENKLLRARNQRLEAERDLWKETAEGCDAK